MPRSSKKFDELLHDIKSPLTSALISCEEVLEIVNDRKSLRKGSLKEYIHDIHESLKYIKGLTCCGNSESREKFNIREIISDSIKSVKKVCTVSCEIKFSSHSDSLYGNRFKFKRVIDNLLINSVEATATVIDIQVEVISANPRGDCIVIKIRDNGLGIGKNNLKKIFCDGFSTKDKTSHSRGLGLSICKSIIEKDFGGEIGVESKVGKGTAFTIRVALK